MKKSFLKKIQARRKCNFSFLCDIMVAVWCEQRLPQTRRSDDWLETLHKFKNNQWDCFNNVLKPTEIKVLKNYINNHNTDNWAMYRIETEEAELFSMEETSWLNSVASNFDKPIHL